MGLQIANNLSRIVQNLLDKGHHFTGLDLNKMAENLISILGHYLAQKWCFSTAEFYLRVTCFYGFLFNLP